MSGRTIATTRDADALVLGLGLLATGGGGLAARGRRYLRELLDDGLTPTWTPLEEIDPAALTCSVYGMGSIAPHPPMTPEERRVFGVTGERHPRPWLRAVDLLEARLEERIAAIVPFELGPSNTIVAVDSAVRSGRTLVDGDYVGRALPKMSQALPAIRGLDVWPLAICDPWGNALLLEDCPSPAVAERIGKMVSKVTKAVDVEASCSHAAFPIPAASVAEAYVPGTLSRCLELGRRVLDARSGGDPVAEAVEAGGGVVLLRGLVRERRWEDSPDGYMEGTTVVSGVDGDRGSTAEIWFLNEHHLVRRDGEPVAMSPDLVAVVDAVDAEPVSNSELEPGRAVVVIAFPAAAAYRQPQALAATAPRHYGIDVDYVPLERLHLAGER